MTTAGAHFCFRAAGVKVYAGQADRDCPNGLAVADAVREAAQENGIDVQDLQKLRIVMIPTFDTIYCGQRKAQTCSDGWTIWVHPSHLKSGITAEFKQLYAARVLGIAGSAGAGATPPATNYESLPGWR
jgi:hypothetical protein